MSATSPAYLEIIDFIASGATSSEVASYRPSAAAQRRVSELIEREQSIGLGEAEKSELNHFVELEHVMRMAKAKAKLLLRQG